ncbi:MAG: DinB family protein [Bacteroidetes bacterium]|nr:DinB family protein [Bacteroidota bacterium]MBU1484313.1 DinB family protein [Bacteroidota bacterium]MBU2046943.1 DinB family protein [Bacteroidota bacterium]MBU2266820.1 DinB family protein [Bacteroidota bacterium]MBU2377023.1 DinB family protein [Bacteroidota bacterium]
MSLKGDINKIQHSIKFYEEFLKTVSEEAFLQNPAEGVWSYSEVYSHILGANYMSLIALEKCLNKTADIKIRKPHWKVRLILFFGRFPPGKIKAPANIAAAVKKISKEEASNLIVKFKKKLNTLLADFKKFDPKYKIKHPRLGFLDAKSWLRFIFIHTKHHQKQITRISKMLHQ